MWPSRVQRPTLDSLRLKLPPSLCRIITPCWLRLCLPAGAELERLAHADRLPVPESPLGLDFPDPWLNHGGQTVLDDPQDGPIPRDPAISRFHR